MRARDAALRHYSIDPAMIRCAWCGTAQGPFELDHMIGGQGQGNQHRHAIRGKLEYWLQRQYRQSGQWPTGFEVLCRPCHQAKGRDERKGESMPIRKGASEIRGSVDDTLAAAFEALAAKSSKSEVLEKALDSYLHGNGTSGMAGVLKAIATHTAAIEDVRQTVKGLHSQIVDVKDGQQSLSFKMDSIRDVVHHLNQDHEADRNARQTSKLRRVLSIIFER